MRIWVTVKSRSAKNEIQKIAEGEYKIWVTAPPVSGKANEAVIFLVADHFQVAKSLVSILSGASSSRKLIEIII